jgi:hypothetical protein
MRRLFALLVITLLSLGPSACGGAGKATSSSSQSASTAATATSTPTTTPATTPATTPTTPATTPTTTPTTRDRDGDGDNNNDDYGYGHAVSAAETQAIAELVKHYYAAAAARDGAKGCSLLYSLLAEEIPELYGEPPGPPELRGSTCAAVMSKLFAHHHQELVTDAATVKLMDVRVKRLRGLAIMSFKGMPQRDIAVHLEHGVWKIDELLDTNLG